MVRSVYGIAVENDVVFKFVAEQSGARRMILAPTLNPNSRDSITAETRNTFRSMRFDFRFGR